MPVYVAYCKQASSCELLFHTTPCSCKLTQCTSMLLNSYLPERIWGYFRCKFGEIVRLQQEYISIYFCFCIYSTQISLNEILCRLLMEAVYGGSTSTHTFWKTRKCPQVQWFCILYHSHKSLKRWNIFFICIPKDQSGTYWLNDVF